jgi:protein-disulfide isomerase
MRRAAVLLLLLSACTSNRWLATIDRRLTHIEESQQDRKEQLDGIDTRLAELTFALAAMSATSQAEELTRKLDELAAEVAVIDGKVAARPTPRRRPEPDIKDVYAVPVAGAPSIGPADALVTIVRAYEYACPYCEKSRPTMAELRKLYPKDVRIVYRAFVVHPTTATLPALAACAAHHQGLFAEADERLWDEAYLQRKFDQAQMELIATEIGADLDQFRADMTGPCATQINDDQQAMARVGTGATPTFYINGRYLSGAQPVPAFVAIIDEEIALAKTRLGKKASTKKVRKKYYDTWVIAKGKADFVPPATP